MKKKKRKRKDKRETQEIPQDLISQDLKSQDLKTQDPSREGYTTDLHKDNKETWVIINKKLFQLTEVDVTLHQLKQKPHAEIPHIRFLAPIPERTSTEQETHNKNSKEIHELVETGGRDPDKVTSVKKAVSMGKDVEEVVHKLLAERDKAKKEGDERKARSIRKQLRKFDYKRYLKK